MKKLLAFLLALLMITACFSVSLAEEDEYQISSIEDAEVEELMDDFDAEDAKEAYMAYARLTASLVSIMSNDAYTLAHTPYTIYNDWEKESDENRAALDFMKYVISTEDSWTMDHAVRSTSELTWKTAKNMRTLYWNFMGYMDALEVSVAAKPEVPAEFQELDAVITSACNSILALKPIVENFYTGTSYSTMGFWGQCEPYYFDSNVTLLKAMLYFENED